jgi:light-regulated signal transduction histidine kinase (bacteriophytochrome)
LRAIDGLLRGLVAEIMQDLHAQEPPRDVALTIDALPCILGDGVLLRQAFENLLANALKYTRGRVVARIHVGHYEENGEIVIFVRDNGVGFDMQQADKLFGMFERLHSAAQFEGTGVGLALVKRIIDRHGGRVWAEGEREAGATLYVTTPQPCGA